MTRAQFRGVLLGYCVLVVAEFLALAGRDSIVPLGIRQAEESLASLVTAPILAGLMLLDIALFAAGMVGMYFFWRPSRFAYLASLLLGLAILLLGRPWRAHTTWDAFVGCLQHILQGAIVALVFWGPGKTLFAKKVRANSDFGRA